MVYSSRGEFNGCVVHLGEVDGGVNRASCVCNMVLVVKVLFLYISILVCPIDHKYVH